MDPDVSAEGAEVKGDVMDEWKRDLIKSVQKYPCLYNVGRDFTGTNVKIRLNAWENVACESSSKVDHCQKTWRSLRDIYVRKMRHKTVKGANYVAKKWQYEDMLSFLKPYVKIGGSPLRVNNDGELNDLPESATFEWSTQLESQLIAMVRVNSGMWRVSVSQPVISEFVKNYCNSTILAHLTCSQKEREKIIRTKWRSLCLRFLKEFTQMTNGQPSPWVHFKNMSFLQNEIREGRFQPNKAKIIPKQRKALDFDNPGAAFIGSWLGSKNFDKLVELWQNSQHDTIPEFFGWMLQVTEGVMEHQDVVINQQQQLLESKQQQAPEMRADQMNQHKQENGHDENMEICKVPLESNPHVPAAAATRCRVTEAQQQPAAAMQCQPGNNVAGRDTRQQQPQQPMQLQQTGPATTGPLANTSGGQVNSGPGGGVPEQCGDSRQHNVIPANVIDYSAIPSYTSARMQHVQSYMAQSQQIQMASAAAAAFWSGEIQHIATSK